MPETLTYINEKFQGKCVLELKKSKLIVKFYKKGQLYRQDQVRMDDLDYETVKYKPEEKAVIVRCHDDNTGCMYRELFLDKIKDHYSRLYFTFDFDQRSGESITKAFIHLIRLFQDDDYSSDEQFE